MIRFFYNNLAPSAVITANSEDPLFPLSNIVHSFRTKTFRTNPLPYPHEITFDFGQSTAISSLCLINHNLGYGDTVMLSADDLLSYLGSSPAFTRMALSFGQTPNPIITDVFPAINYRYVRLSILKSGTTFSELGMVFLGDYFSPSVNFRLGWKDRVIDRSTTSKSQGGQTHTDIRQNYRKISIKFDMLTDTDKSGFLTMKQTVGTHLSHIIDLDPANPAKELTFYGKFTAFSAMINRYTARHTQDLVFEEDL